MRNKLAIVLGASLVSAVLFAAAPVLANHHQASNACSSEIAQYKHAWMMMLDQHAKDLNLTTDQKSKIKALREANRAQIKQLWASMKDSRQQIHQLIQSSDYTDEKAQAIIATKAATIQKTMLMRANTAHQIWMLLTPEQQKKWQDMISKMKSNMKSEHDQD